VNIRHTEVRPRERLINAAYDLFSKDGVSQVGIDTILAKSDCAKASLYSNFKTKVELAIAFLHKREAVWTRGWLESEIKRRAKTPEGRLLAIFDVFDGWFHKKSFEGCSFINVLLESKEGSPVRQAEDPRYRARPRRGSKPAGTRKIRAGLAYVDEGIDRFCRRREPKCCSRRQVRGTTNPQRLETEARS
jgi:AcrR family transcriptional regulator